MSAMDVLFHYCSSFQSVSAQAAPWRHQSCDLCVNGKFTLLNTTPIQSQNQSNTDTGTWPKSAFSELDIDTGQLREIHSGSGSPGQNINAQSNFHMRRKRTGTSMKNNNNTSNRHQRITHVPSRFVPKSPGWPPVMGKQRQCKWGTLFNPVKTIITRWRTKDTTHASN